MKHKLWTITIAVFASLGIVLAISSYTIQPAKATVTKWWKVAPSTCVVDPIDEDLYDTNAYGTMTFDYTVTGNQTIYAYCPVHLPDGVVMNKLRARSFQDPENGIPANTWIRVYFRRTQWTGGTATLATSYIPSGSSYDDADFSSTVDNENYQYVLQIFLNRYYTANDHPELDMIEIRYDE